MTETSTQKPRSNHKPKICNRYTGAHTGLLPSAQGTFSRTVCWENCGQLHVKVLNCSLTPCTKVNSKWIKDLNVRSEDNKFPEEKTGRMLSDIHLSNIFFLLCLLRQMKQNQK